MRRILALTALLLGVACAAVGQRIGLRDADGKPAAEFGGGVIWRWTGIDPQGQSLPAAGGTYLDPSGRTVTRLTDRALCPAGANRTYADTWQASEFGFVLECRYDRGNLNLYRSLLIGPDRKTILFADVAAAAKAPRAAHEYKEMQWLPGSRRLLAVTRSTSQVTELDPWAGTVKLYAQMPPGCVFDWRVAPNGNIVAHTADKTKMCVFDGVTVRSKDMAAVASGVDQTSILLDGRPLFTWNRNPHRAYSPDLATELIFDDFHGHLGQFRDAAGKLYTVDTKEDKLADGSVGQNGCPGIQPWRREEGIYDAVTGKRADIWGCDYGPPSADKKWGDRDRGHYSTSQAVNRFFSSGWQAIVQWDVDWTAGTVKRTELAKAHNLAGASYWEEARAAADLAGTMVLWDSPMCDGQFDTDGTPKTCGKANVDVYVVDAVGAPTPPPPPPVPPPVVVPCTIAKAGPSLTVTVDTAMLVDGVPVACKVTVKP